jgi:hypothetical protein
MARSINDYYNMFRDLVRKERGVFVSITQFNGWMDDAQMDCFEEWFRQYGVNQQVHDALQPFRVYLPFTSNSAGFVTYSDDHVHLLGQPFTVTGSTVNRIVFLNEDELPFALTSQLRPVTTSYPIAVDSSTGFSIYPQSEQIGAYFYLRRPATPQLVVTTSGRTLTYDSAASTQLEWNEVYINNIIAKALRYAGLNMDEKGVSDFANQYNQES